MDIASALERYLLDLVNAERVAHGLGLLQLELNLNGTAHDHSAWMAQTDTFSHTGVGGSSMTERIVAGGFDLTGDWRTAENIAAVSISGPESLFDEVDRLHQNLMDSPSHRANILTPDLDFLGLGLVVAPLTYASGNTRDSLILTQNFASASLGVADLDILGGAGNDVIQGGAGEDYLGGGNGNDRLITGAGQDTVEGGAGNDTIEAGTGIKTIDGGAGNDTLVLSMAQDAPTLTLVGGLLQVTSGASSYTLQNVEQIAFDDGTVSVAQLIDTLLNPPLRVTQGTAGSERLEGGAGRDLIIGGGGADTLIGGAGDDVILAEARGLYGSDASAQVYRLFDTVFGREPASSGHHGFAEELASGARSLTDLAEVFVGSAEFQIRYGETSNAEFITLLFQNVFGRDPAPAGRDAWANELDMGRSRAEVVALFSEEQEHMNLTRAGLEAFETRHDQTEWVDEVYRLFGAMFDRAPGESGFQAWTKSLADGTDLDQVVRDFMASEEFQLTYGSTTNREFVTLLFQNVLDRNPAQAGLDAWSHRLDQGDTRESLVRDFLDTQEYVLNSTPELVGFVRSLGADDRIEAGAGDSLLSGGIGYDSFVFDTSDDGTHHVVDLEAWDVLNLTGFGYASTTDALAQITQEGDHAVFEDQGVRIVLTGWDATEITAQMIDIV